MVSKYFTALLVYKTKFSNPCHALKNCIVVKGLIVSSHTLTDIILHPINICMYELDAL